MENNTDDRNTVRRFETKEAAPSLLELKATQTYPSSEKSTIGYWVANTTKDFKSKGVPFIPPTSPGAWVTLHPRSVMIPQNEGYLQVKGSGNPDRPNFPPSISPSNLDMGHKTVWSVSKEEAEQVIHKANMLERCGIEYSEINKIVKLEEVPVPINSTGGSEIRSIHDAYTIPWEYADHVRVRQVNQMRRVLENKYQAHIPNDRVVVEIFQEYEGFYQIHTEKPLPFKNEIGSLICTPIVLDYLSGNDKTSLKTQAENINWVMSEVGKAFNIPELIAVKMQQYDDLENVLEVSNDKLSVEASRLDYRPFANTFGNSTTEKTANILRKRFGIPKNKPIVQLDGIKYVKRIVDSLSQDSKDKLLLEINSAQRQLMENLVLATINGIGLNQTISAKDSTLGRVSDLMVAGTIPGSKNDHFEDEVLLSIKYAEDACINSCVELATLYGTDTTDFMNRAVLSVAYGSTISQIARGKQIDASHTSNDPEYGQKYGEAFEKIKKRFEIEKNIIEDEEERGSPNYYLRLGALLSKIPIVISSIIAPNLNPL